MELKGSRGLFDTVKSSRTCSVATVSLRLGVLPGFGGCFGRKMAVFGPKLRRFGRAQPDLAPTPRAATGEFLAQNLDLARPPPMLQDGYMGKRSEELGRSNGQNGTETCCCLLLLLLLPLLAKFKGRGRGVVICIYQGFHSNHAQTARFNIPTLLHCCNNHEFVVHVWALQ